MAPSSDWKVEIVDASGDADYSVTVVGDQVVDLTGASTGDVLTVQPDGTVAPEDPHPSLTVHAVGDPGEPAFQNSWVNYAGGWEAARFYKDSDGVVHLDGLVKSGTIGQNIFVLRVGFRPFADHLFVVAANQAHGEVYVQAGGAVIAAFGSNTYLSLSTITFLAA